jgi:hypothetical protein
MRPGLLTAVLCGAALAGCGGDEPLAPLPASGGAYRGLDEARRLAVAEGCRARAVAAAREVAAEQLARVDAAALRAELDSAYRIRREQRRPVADVCRDRLPFVTPGIRVSFDDAKDGGDAYLYETRSDRPLRIRGTVDPVPRAGTVVAAREFGAPRPVSGAIRPDGGFALPAVRLREVADNSFIVTIDAPPNAPRKVDFSAICLDCLAGGPPPE